MPDSLGAMGTLLALWALVAGVLHACVRVVRGSASVSAAPAAAYLLEEWYSRGEIDEREHELVQRRLLLSRR